MNEGTAMRMSSLEAVLAALEPAFRSMELRIGGFQREMLQVKEKLLFVASQQAIDDRVTNSAAHANRCEKLEAQVSGLLSTDGDFDEITTRLNSLTFNLDEVLKGIREPGVWDGWRSDGSIRDDQADTRENCGAELSPNPKEVMPPAPDAPAGTDDSTDAAPPSGAEKDAAGGEGETVGEAMDRLNREAEKLLDALCAGRTPKPALTDYERVNAEMAAGCLAMIRDTLTHYLGEKEMLRTPPMMYPEAIHRAITTHKRVLTDEMVEGASIESHVAETGFSRSVWHCISEARRGDRIRAIRAALLSTGAFVLPEDAETGNTKGPSNIPGIIPSGTSPSDPAAGGKSE